MVRYRSAALVGTLAWLTLLEPAVRGIKPCLGKYLPGQAATDLIATASSPGRLAPAGAAVALVAVTLLALALATLSRRRDVA